MTLHVGFRHNLGPFMLDVAFEGSGDGVTALFGPSGAGKSLTLTVIAGALVPDSGHISLNGRVLLDTARQCCVALPRRRIGWVHQDGRLFPHLSVAGNLDYGLKRARRAHRIARSDVVAALGIGHLLERRTRDLSGGERQRVAVGRALLGQPDLLLLDEPLAALDTARKAEVLRFLCALKSNVGLPMIYVSHDRAEVDSIADKVIEIDRGRVLDGQTKA